MINLACDEERIRCPVTVCIIHADTSSNHYIEVSSQDDTSGGPRDAERGERSPRTQIYLLNRSSLVWCPTLSMSRNREMRRSADLKMPIEYDKTSII